jgi:NADH-quinone oxidoreductase subunit J
VTFLFVIMLAQMEGKAPYDRASRSPGPAAFACFLLLWCLIYSISAISSRSVSRSAKGGDQLAERVEFARARGLPRSGVVERAIPPTMLIRNANNQLKPDVAGLGESLYTTHLVSVGLSGVLLFVALVAAVAITNPKRPGSAMETS